MSNVVVIHFEGTNSFRLDSPVILFLSLSFFLSLSLCPFFEFIAVVQFSS